MWNEFEGRVFCDRTFNSSINEMCPGNVIVPLEWSVNYILYKHTFYFSDNFGLVVW